MRLEEAERLILEGDVTASATLLNESRATIEGLQGLDGCRLRGWHRIACSEHAARAGQRDAARRFLEEAQTELASAPLGSDRTEFEIRVHAALGFLATPEDPESFYVSHAERAVARADDARRVDTLLALVWVAARTGDYHQARGSWDRARASFERAIAWCERLAAAAESGRGFWTPRAALLMGEHGRVTASMVAVKLGEVAWALGRREEAVGWLDRAVGLVEPTATPFGRLTLARALVVRGQHEPSITMADIGPRVARLERAVQVALDAKTPDGQALASDAELLLASLHGSAGSPERALDHARRAHEHVQAIPAHSDWPQAARALLQQGALLRERGGDEALAPLTAALALGRYATNPELRQLAASAAHQLHALKLELDGPDAARATLEALDQMIPSLEPPARDLFAVASARAHLHHEAKAARWDAARAACARAEELVAGGELRIPHVARAIAMDRGDLAAANGELEESVPHYRRALAFRTEPDAPPDEMAARAEVALKLARALLGLERVEDAWAELGRAYALGRDSGRTEGRESAAIAALIQGDLSVDRPDERKKLYTTALGLARLSHSRRGTEIGAAARLRLNELAGREPKDP